MDRGSCTPGPRSLEGVDHGFILADRRSSAAGRWAVGGRSAGRGGAGKRDGEVQDGVYELGKRDDPPTRRAEDI